MRPHTYFTGAPTAENSCVLARSALREGIMHQFTKYFWILSGVLSFAGGLVGYLKKDSVISLVAGGAFGLVWIASGLLLAKKGRLAAILATVTSLLILGRFLPAYLKKGEPFPAIPMIVLSVGCLGLAVAQLKRRTN